MQAFCVSIIIFSLVFSIKHCTVLHSSTEIGIHHPQQESQHAAVMFHCCAPIISLHLTVLKTFFISSVTSSTTLQENCSASPLFPHALPWIHPQSVIWSCTASHIYCSCDSHVQSCPDEHFECFPAISSIQSGQDNDDGSYGSPFLLFFSTSRAVFQWVQNTWYQTRIVHRQQQFWLLKEDYLQNLIEDLIRVKSCRVLNSVDCVLQLFNLKNRCM